MNAIKISMTAQQPSFGMSVYGSAPVCASATHGVIRPARVRLIDGFAAATADAAKTAKAIKVAPVTGALWEIHAWRPPIC